MSITSLSSRPQLDPRISQHPRPGVYKIINAQGGTVVDLSGTDATSITAFPEHGEEASNQQWNFERLGAGYSIQSMRNSAYLTVNSARPANNPIEASLFPVSWEIEVYDLQNSTYRIRWPGSRAVFDLKDWGNSRAGNKIDLRAEQQPIHPCQLWRLAEVPQYSKITPPHSPAQSSVDLASVSDWETVKELPTSPDAPVSGHTIADTVIDAEGLRVGGNGEIAITTTTTTTTTTVTRVKRLNVG
ncbi:hypothetical protein PM082_011136 [Marasmius tenuissimus]|nr:hypothetical protein PM082_011136 [Marasmius tenuissimus]